MPAKKTDTRARRKSGITRKAAKAKGRRGVQRVRDLLLEHLRTLTPEDISVKAGSQNGADLQLSTEALRRFPFAIEVKYSEALNIWSALKQSTKHPARIKVPIGGGFKDITPQPLVFFMRNGSEVYVAMPAKEFMQWVS